MLCDTMSMSVCPVNVSVRNSTGLLELNRPKALNSLNPRMVDLITDALEKWADDPDVHRVIIYSSSPKAFCAGGDVRLVREEITGGSYKAGDKFFLDEYEMNNALANFPKPVVALIDGVAMGGGLGISAHGSHRVITENALAAMPEMVIGFSPDVGMTWMMARMVGEPGRPIPALASFALLTGWRFSPADMLWSGLATDYVPSEDLGEFMDTVIAESLDDALERFSTQPTGESELAVWLPEIEECFGHSTWADISAALSECANTEFVELVHGLMRDANPSSVVATVELFNANLEASSLRVALENENAIGSELRREPNFPEGVRAVLVDKTRDAEFTPSDYNDVDVRTYRTILS